jgi:hypothetical protein
MDKKIPLCACGCGEQLKKSKWTGKFTRKYLPGHYKRGPLQPDIHSKESRKKMSDAKEGAKNWNWKGGISLQQRELNNVISVKIRKRDNNKCQDPRCKGRHKEKKPNVHHINHDVKDNREQNLITLCIGCHISHHMRRDGKSERQKLYQEIVKRRKQK